MVEHSPWGGGNGEGGRGTLKLSHWQQSTQNCWIEGPSNKMDVQRWGPEVQTGTGVTACECNHVCSRRGVNAVEGDRQKLAFLTDPTHFQAILPLGIYICRGSHAVNGTGRPSTLYLPETTRELKAWNEIASLLRPLCVRRLVTTHE